MKNSHDSKDSVRHGKIFLSYIIKVIRNELFGSKGEAEIKDN